MQRAGRGCKELDVDAHLRCSPDLRGSDDGSKGTRSAGPPKAQKPEEGQAQVQSKNEQGSTTTSSIRKQRLFLPPNPLVQEK
jgi:hypothetical protein